MAKKKETKKETLDISKLSVGQARESLQKVVLDIRSGLEKDVSKIKKLKKHIARKLTKGEK